MPTKLQDIKKPKDIYIEKVRKLISNLKDGYGYTKEEIGKELGVGVTTVDSLHLPKIFKTVKINGYIYFIK